MADHLRNRRLLATCAVGFCVLFTLLATFTYVNFYLAAPPFRLGTQALGLLFTVYLLGMIVTPASGRYIDRVGHRAAIAAAFTACIGGIALTLIQSLAAVILGLALLSSGVFIAQAVTSSYIGIATNHARASAVGIYSVFYYAGGTLGSAVPGLFWIHGRLAGLRWVNRACGSAHHRNRMDMLAGQIDLRPASLCSNRYSSFTTCTVTSAVTSLCSRTGTLNSPSCLMGSSNWILLRSMV